MQNIQSNQTPYLTTGNAAGTPADPGSFNIPGAGAAPAPAPFPSESCPSCNPVETPVPSQSGHQCQSPREAQALTAAAELEALALRALPLRKSGHTWKQIAILCGTSPATALRVCRAYESQGLAGLIPGKRTGRPRKSTLPDTAEATLKELHLDQNRRRATGQESPNSMRMTQWKFAHRAECPDDLRAELLQAEHKQRIHPSIHRVLKSISPVVQSAHRDRDTALARAYWQPIGNYWLDEHGTEHELLPGHGATYDDATVNFHFIVPWPWGGDKCSEKYGVRLGRFQLLAGVDLRTLFVRSFQLICRWQESYRGDDVASFLGHDLRSHSATHGLPKFMKLEGGAWQSSNVQGLRTTDEDDTTASLRIGGLRSLGIRTIRAWDSNDKAAIEARWNLLWTAMGDIPGQIGRQRGEIRDTTLLATRCQNGTEDPRKHFLAFDHAVAAINGAIDLVNAKPIHSTRHGTWIPQTAWDLAAREHTATIPDSAGWIFAPVKRLWTVHGCQVYGTVQGPKGNAWYSFAAPALSEWSGKKVCVFFDPAREAAATVTDQNGTYICLADDMQEVPAASFAAEGYQSETQTQQKALRKACRDAVISEHRACGTRMKRIFREIRDGQGQIARSEIGTGGSGTPAAQPPQPRPAAAPRRSQLNTDDLEARLAEAEEANPF